MTATGAIRGTGKYIRANGIDIHYNEAGRGRPLILLHGGMVSSSPIWAGSPVAYATYMQQLAETFRVIAPDTRGSSGTVHPGGDSGYEVLVNDVLAFIEALDLDRPFIAGFSDGGIIATILGIRNPDAVGAIVNDAGYDFFNPEAATYQTMRVMLGGRPDATEADPEAVQAFFEGQAPMRLMFETMKADQDGAQGEGHWKEYLRLAFERTTHSPGYTFDDLSRVTVPTMILVGDRDHFCSVEEAVVAYRRLPDAELAILPGTDHVITPEGIEAMTGFLRRQ
jgi:pimeloyl-ACP methyl ester carboxylesterase